MGLGLGLDENTRPDQTRPGDYGLCFMCTFDWTLHINHCKLDRGALQVKGKKKTLEGYVYVLNMSAL